MIGKSFYFFPYLGEVSDTVEKITKIFPRLLSGSRVPQKSYFY